MLSHDSVTELAAITSSHLISTEHAECREQPAFSAALTDETTQLSSSSSSSIGTGTGTGSLVASS